MLKMGAGHGVHVDHANRQSLKCSIIESRVQVSVSHHARFWNTGNGYK